MAGKGATTYRDPSVRASSGGAAEIGWATVAVSIILVALFVLSMFLVPAAISVLGWGGTGIGRWLLQVRKILWWIWPIIAVGFIAFVAYARRRGAKDLDVRDMDELERILKTPLDTYEGLKTDELAKKYEAEESGTIELDEQSDELAEPVAMELDKQSDGEI